jgi:AP2 domain
MMFLPELQRCPGRVLPRRGCRARRRGTAMARAYVEIPLGGKKAAGRVALVDPDDYFAVVNLKWTVWEQLIINARPNGPYAIASIYRESMRTTIRMHTFLTGFSETDHKNNDGLDNRRNNLRDSCGRNAQNQRPWLNGVSRYKGVHLLRSGRWGAAIGVNGSTFLGCFDSEEDAARAYDVAARKFFQVFAFLNFPEEVAGPQIPAVTLTQSIRRGGPRRGSRYKGVSWSKTVNKWRSRIMIDGHENYLGVFSCEEDAAKAYDIAARNAWGSDCYLNFPEGYDNE